MEKSTVMVGGDGPNSYFRNSKLQGRSSDEAKMLLTDGIAGALEINKDLGVFSIADLGCSVGPNTFSSVKTMIEAVKRKYRTHYPEVEIPEFFVFFNDQVTNDFNTLFRELPEDREYMAAGVPGSFRGRLFAKSSINLMSSSMALHWLTKVPDDVTKRDSPLWNKGKITYARSSNQVVEAFTAEFFSEMKIFLCARSEELAPGGLLAILMPCRPQGTLPSEAIQINITECLVDALADMVNEGITSEDLIDSFNVPGFFPMVSEMKEIVISSNNHFTIERLEERNSTVRLNTPKEIQFFSAHTKAAMQCILCEHFGKKVVDELFKRYPQKLEKFIMATSPVQYWPDLFMLLKRNGGPSNLSNKVR